MNRLFVRKSIDLLKREADEGIAGEPRFTRTLTAFQLTMLGVGGVIGSGIFVMTGQEAARHAGPAVVLSFALAAVPCLFAGLCYAEMAASVPISGSAYTYAYATMGEFIAWLIGWDLILEYAVSAVVVAIGWSGYIVSLLSGFGIELPPRLLAAPGTVLIRLDDKAAASLHMTPGWTERTEQVVALLDQSGDKIDAFPRVSAIVNLPAALVVLGISLLLIRGIREAAGFNTFIVVVKVGIVLLFILVGWRFINPSYLKPFVPPNPDEFKSLRDFARHFGSFGWTGVLRASGVVFFAYIGFDAVSTAAQETLHPKRDMPIGILATLLICTILYMGVAYVLAGVAPYKTLDVPDPIAVGVDRIVEFNRARYGWLSVLVKLGALLGLSSVILVSLLGQSRIFHAMARDGLLPSFAARLHPKYHTPHLTTMLTGGASAIAAGLVPMHIVGELVSIGTLFAFAVVSAGVLVLRRTHPDMPRAFKTPLVSLTAPLAILSCLALMATLPTDTWLRLVIWMAFGLSIYSSYGYRHSKLGAKSAGL